MPGGTGDFGYTCFMWRTVGLVMLCGCATPSASKTAQTNESSTNSEVSDTCRAANQVCTNRCFDEQGPYERAACLGPDGHPSRGDSPPRMVLPPCLVIDMTAVAACSHECDEMTRVCNAAPAPAPEAVGGSSSL